MPRIRVLIFHGYLLRGTGSNVYTASLARALARLGHDVHLLCQDRQAPTLPWVDAVGTWEGGELGVRATGSGPAGSGEGTVTAYLPDIGGLLPVYVEDRYAGFAAKRFADLSEAELDGYLDANVAAVGDVAADAGGIDAALANHLIAGPAILARAGLRYAAKVHGSALSYTVRPNPRFLPLAREGMDGAAGVLVGSQHVAESLWEAIDDPDLPARTRLGPPGVDVELFAPLHDEDPGSRIAALAREVEADPGEGGFGRDAGAASAALGRLAGAEGPRVGFVGKLIVSKGVDLLLAAWPLVVRRHPGAMLLIVGFGEYKPGLERLLAALTDGDLAAAREIARRGRGLEGGEERPLSILSSFLSDPPAGYVEAARAAAGSVAFTGRLEHDEVGRLAPALDAWAVPSTFPEAFGMVAAEAAAAGALPVCADHSGLHEVAAALAAELPQPVGRLVAFPVDDDAPRAIAERLVAWLDLPDEDRQRSRAALSATSGRLWSWRGVARGVIDASAGRLDELPVVPSG